MIEANQRYHDQLLQVCAKGTALMSIPWIPMLHAKAMLNCHQCYQPFKLSRAHLIIKKQLLRILTILISDMQ